MSNDNEDVPEPCCMCGEPMTDEDWGFWLFDDRDVLIHERCAG